MFYTTIILLIKMALSFVAPSSSVSSKHLHDCESVPHSANYLK
jgi:hypothetical protein